MINQKPKISVITPLYNSAQFISKTIESVQSQTYRNYEHIIIDDCSSDDSYAIAEQKSFEDKRIVLLKNEVNSRVSLTRNRGIDIATGDYIMFLDSDDILVYDAMEILINLMLSSEALIYTAPYQKMSEDGSKLLGVITPPKCVLYKDMLKTCTMPFMTTIISRCIVGDHRLKNVHHEDYLFWLEILKEGYCCYGYCEKPLGFYRLTSNSLSRNKLNTIKYQWNIYRNELNFDVIRSFYYFTFYAFNGLAKHWK